MKREKEYLTNTIESKFRELVNKDGKTKNAHLRVNASELDVDIKCAEGQRDLYQIHPDQPIHLTSVGKLFTATLVAILKEKGQLDLNDRIIKHLDSKIAAGLHIYRGTDYTGNVLVRHLLNQTSGLYNVFHHLYEQILKDPGMKITTQEAILWGKKNLAPIAPPGKRFFYTDTNYYLLGLIIEKVTGKPFYEVMHELIFDPLGMESAYMYGFTEPKVKSEYPMATLYLDGVDVSSLNSFAQIDHAGGTVVATLDDYLTFMKALTKRELIKKETLNGMLDDDISMGLSRPGFRYGHSIWKIGKVPLLFPGKYSCWGAVGITGAFMFYHPWTDSYIIGSFNDSRYRTKSLRYMISIVKDLTKFADKM